MATDCMDRWGIALKTKMLIYIPLNRVVCVRILAL